MNEPTSDDAALVLSVDDLQLARKSGFAQAFVIGNAEKLTRVADEFANAYVVPERFEYLADGDVIGMDPRSGRFRVHYRRASSHNSLLVTERCNHYCLMCSQPPKDVDDRWILKEIRSSLRLIDHTTKTLGFTGGEPLLDWEEFIDVLGVCRDVLPNTRKEAVVYEGLDAAGRGLRLGRRPGSTSKSRTVGSRAADLVRSDCNGQRCIRGFFGGPCF
jgi:hypothetical protein